MKFIVDPLIREKIMIGSDLPAMNSYKVLVDEYKKMFEERGAILDLSKMEQYSNAVDVPWYFETLDETYRQTVKERQLKDGLNNIRFKIFL